MRQEWVGKRRAVRTTVQLRAQMRFEAGRSPVECTINDISLTGARLTVPDAGPYPDDFDIFIPARSETKWARIRWQEDLQLGVEFLKGRRTDEGMATAAILSRLSALEKQHGTGAAGPGAAFNDAAPIAALEARLATLEQRCSLQQSDKPASELDAGSAWLEATLDRIAEMEKRCATVESEVQRGAARLDAVDSGLADLARTIEDLTDRQSPQETKATESAQANSSFSGSESGELRLRSLEAAAAELRGSLQALILLISAQIARSAQKPERAS